MLPLRCHKQLPDMTKSELQVALAAATDTTNGWLLTKSTSAVSAKGTVTLGSAEGLADSA